MKKYIFLFIIINIISLQAEPNLSPMAKEMYYRLTNGNPNSSKYELLKDFPLKEISLKNKNFENIQSSEANFSVSCLIKVNKSFSSEKMQNKGVHLVKISPEIYTVQIPVNYFTEFTEEAGIEYIQADGFAEPHLDSAILASNIYQVKQGKNNLPKSYTGKGVIVGIIDWGFDYTHPAFYDSLNQKFRILRVWDQTAMGNPPAQFSYGAEFKSAEEIHGAKSDYSESSHGTHVAGIAAGEGWPSAFKYEGIAPESELVFVALRHPRPEFTGYTNAFSDFIDAAKYIFDYAESVGKPVVINLSWGNVLGPKDGKSIMSDALEAMVGKGKIFVGSAGNSGKNNVHCCYNCTPADTVFRTYFNYSGNILFSPKEIFVDLWGEESKKFGVNLTAIKSAVDLNKVVETGFFEVEKDTILKFELPYSDSDTISVTAFIKTKEYDTRPRILLNIKSKNFIWFKLEAKSTDSEIHIFSSLLKNGTGYISYFTKLSDSGAVAGNSEYTICDWVSSDRILCIGASVTKEGFTNTKGQSFRMGQGLNGDRALFSSIGPALDKRIKPDITAPGSVLVSSVNSYDKNYGGLSNSTDMVQRLSFNNRTYTYSAYQGTSMSSPVVTGSIALLLEAKPDLNPESVIDLIKSTAIVDSFTTDTIPDYFWGAGKLNTLAAMSKLLGINSIDAEELNYHIPRLFPNPVHNQFTIELPLEFQMKCKYIIYNHLGEEVVLSEELEKDVLTVNTKDFPNGTYFIKIISKDKTITNKFIVNK